MIVPLECDSSLFKKGHIDRYYTCLWQLDCVGLDAALSKYIIISLRLFDCKQDFLSRVSHKLGL